MNVILGMTEMVLDTTLTEAQRTDLGAFAMPRRDCSRSSTTSSTRRRSRQGR